MKILIIEDHQELANSIISYLENEKFNCTSVHSFNESLSLLSSTDFDCYLIDLGLPDGDGMELIKVLKERDPDSAIIILSAKDSMEKKVEALKTGADDYLTKPFNLPELNARIDSLLRRKKVITIGDIIFKEIRINPDSFKVFIHRTPIHLTKKEYDLLLYLMNNKNKVITKHAIVEHLWGESKDMSSSDFIYTHIKNLRKKLDAAGCNDYIQNVNRIGYRFQG